MTPSHVERHLSTGLAYLECPNHKTAKPYGEVGKMPAPGHRSAPRASQERRAVPRPGEKGRRAGFCGNFPSAL